MGKSILAASIMLIALSATAMFGQISNATVSGTIEDATHAVLPGVNITATNMATGVTTTAVSNEAGAYNLASLLPGKYKVTGELPGFQTKTYEITLGNAQTVRLNFTLSVAGVGTAVEVSVAVDTLLATSSASIGEVLSQQKVQDLPLVGNNVLSLLGLVAPGETAPRPRTASPKAARAEASWRSPRTRRTKPLGRAQVDLRSRGGRRRRKHRRNLAIRLGRAAALRSILFGTTFRTPPEEKENCEPTMPGLIRRR